MNVVRSVAKNTFVLITGRVIGEFLGLVTAVFLTRYLGPANLGIYSFVFAYLAFFNIITDLGINDIILREVSRNIEKADTLIGNGIVMTTVFSIFAVITSCLIILPLNYPPLVKISVVIASLGFILSFKNMYLLIFQASLHMEYSVLSSIVTNVLKLAAFFYLIAVKAPLVWFIAAGVIVILPSALLMACLSKKFIIPKFNIDLKVWKYLLSESWPIVLLSTFTMIYHRIDQVMLFQMKGAQEAGYYSAAVKLPEIFVIFPSAFMASAFPLMSKYFKASDKSLVGAYTLSFRYLMMLIIPVAMGAMMLAAPIIKLIYGESFLPAAPVLSVLAWAEVFIFYGLIHYEIVVAVNRQRLLLFFSGAGAVINVILNLILIPRYGMMGAGVATLIAYMLSAGLVLGILLPSTRRYNIVGLRSMLKPLAASVIMGLYVYYMKSCLAAAILGGALIFGLVMIALKGIEKKDILLVKSIFCKSSL